MINILKFLVYSERPISGNAVKVPNILLKMRFLEKL